eukprot:SAG31_NODE_41165_length_277_cov_0.865169_1_plen_63_part_01
MEARAGEAVSILFVLMLARSADGSDMSAADGAQTNSDMSVPSMSAECQPGEYRDTELPLCGSY